MHVTTAQLCVITGLSLHEFHNLKKLTYPNLPSARAPRYRQGASPKGWPVEVIIPWLRRTLHTGISADTESRLRAAARVIAT